MLGKLLKRKSEPVEEMLVSPVNGQSVDIGEVPDPTFSEKMMGDGIAIKPEEGKVVAPIDSEVVQVFPTKHAVGLKTRSGVELLIHIGLETVSMDGEGFEAHVKQGQRIKSGDALISFDLNLVAEKAADTVIPVIITNVDQVDILNQQIDKNVQAGQTAVMTVKAQG
ncbi:PTS sugar transporter subunit IIA [Tuberibacillus sp. Marseille-P3662]|uniref:PTS sugar transporter subunit IIA n=1 Tax=Tuberibacillus sp. Marseille-P3662 TaxID=1965358 RepID=UPI000A1CAF1A|nr:PTS glucose transporter subunit IIA [Tuberibacillus sp. Marseille-P3662]